MNYASMSSKRPVIGIPADRRMIGQQAYHLVGEKYLTAVLDGAGGVPLIVPALESVNPAGSEPLVTAHV